MLRDVQAEDRAATPDEQQVLARWSGWGALPLIFEPRPTHSRAEAKSDYDRATGRWDALSGIRDEVRSLLSDREWNDARRNTLNAHYTDAALVKAVWGAMREFGFDGGRVLEPGSGVGNFIGLAPRDTRLPVEMTGVEVESTTAAISRLLYPDSTIHHAGLEALTLPDGAFDGGVGNVPFGKYKVFDRIHNSDRKLSIHDHFTLKTLASVRPGGVVAVITSRFTLDAKDPEARERLYALGDLVGAVRLPARAHAAAAGTDVVTDVLFLRRREPGAVRGDDTWLQTVERFLPGHEDDPVRFNAYFAKHPEHVVGKIKGRIGQFGPELTVEAGNTPVAAGLAVAAAGMAAGATKERAALGMSFNLPDGSLGLDDAGNPTIVDSGWIVPLEIHPLQRDKLVELIRLKDMVRSLYAAEAATVEPGETANLAELRAELRDAYRAYRKTNPPLTKPRQVYRFTPPEAKDRTALYGLDAVPDEWKSKTAFAWIDDDPDAALLFGLEEWDDKAGRGVEQKVLTERVLEPRELPTSADSIETAVALAMEHDGGRLDLGRVAELLGVDLDEAVTRIGDVAFRDPGQDGTWEPQHRYLSGNVRAKLDQAREAAALDPSYAANVVALERVQPDDLTPAEIKAKIGAPWIPLDVYNAFLHELGFPDAEVKHAGGTVWEVTGAKDGDTARKEWGTGSRSTQDLFHALLTQTDSTIEVRWTDSEGKSHLDKEATDSAREKARLIAQRWEDWIWASTERAERLADIYNRRFNNLVLPDYDASPLTLPGLVSTWTMRPHQNAAIRRILYDPTALLAHVVGAGKTATMAAGAMELKRTGLAKKPAIVVPNHMLKQVTADFRKLYPNAKLLAINASALGTRRAQFMARIAGGEWDAVILTHEAFNRVPLRPETQKDYLDREMAILRDQLDAASRAGMHERTIKQIETSIANAEAKILQQIAQASEPGVCLEDTGIDYLFMDEAHEYKNLRTVSGIPGAAIDGSAKATKLHMVLEHLRENSTSGRVGTLATGTPIANSVTEAYVLMRYLGPDLLDEMGVDTFDNWAATFGEVVSALEPDPKGQGYRYKARFSRFFNVPELMVSYRSFADVQMAEDLKLPVPPVRSGPNGERGETVVIPATEAQRAYIKELPGQPWINEPGGVLKALGEGLRASLDMRLVGGAEDQGSKLSYVAENVAAVYRETKDVVYPVSEKDPTPQELPGSLQLIFLDEGTPGSSAKNPVNLYADLRDKLAELGVPRERVRFIHEAATDRKKEQLFADCRDGKVSVLIGSTSKMGTGTNIQDRAIALHHVSYPWRPADMEQREGRVPRQGNLNVPAVSGTPDDVRIFFYITERTFDEFRLTTLARKARFIGQIQRRDFKAREIEDLDAAAVGLGMLSALASGDPSIMQLAEATAERARLQGLARSWDQEQDQRVQQLDAIDAHLALATTSLEQMRVAAPSRKTTAGDAFAMTVDGARYTTREAAGDALGTRMATLARDSNFQRGDRVPVGELGGLPFHAEIAFDGAGRRQLKLRFGWGHIVPMGHRDDRAQWHASTITPSNGRGAVQALERFLSGLDDDITKLDSDIAKVRDRRAEISANLRSKDTNPYRWQARSKEREEKHLGELVIANDRLADLAPRLQNLGEDAGDDQHAEVEELRAEIAKLRSAIDEERAIQEDPNGAQRRPAHSTSGPAKPQARLAAIGTPPEPTTPDAGTSPLKEPSPTTGQTPHSDARHPTAVDTPQLVVTAPDPGSLPEPAQVAPFVDSDALPEFDGTMSDAYSLWEATPTARVYLGDEPGAIKNPDNPVAALAAAYLSAQHPVNDAELATRLMTIVAWAGALLTALDETASEFAHGPEQVRDDLDRLRAFAEHARQFAVRVNRDIARSNDDNGAQPQPNPPLAPDNAAGTQPDRADIREYDAAVRRGDTAALKPLRLRIPVPDLQIATPDAYDDLPDLSAGPVDHTPYAWEAALNLYDEWVKTPTARTYRVLAPRHGQSPHPIWRLDEAYRNADAWRKRSAATDPSGFAAAQGFVVAWVDALLPALSAVADEFGHGREQVLSDLDLLRRFGRQLREGAAGRLALTQVAPAMPQPQHSPTPGKPAPTSAAPPDTDTGSSKPARPVETAARDLRNPAIREAATTALVEATVGSREVTQWATANEPDRLGLVLSRWLDDWAVEQYDGRPSEAWPDWARAWFSASPEDRDDVVHAVAASVHTRENQPPPSGDPDPTPDHPITPANARPEPNASNTDQTDVAPTPTPEHAAYPQGTGELPRAREQLVEAIRTWRGTRTAAVEKGEIGRAVRRLSEAGRAVLADGLTGSPAGDEVMARFDELAAAASQVDALLGPVVMPETDKLALRILTRRSVEFSGRLRATFQDRRRGASASAEPTAAAPPANTGPTSTAESTGTQTSDGSRSTDQGHDGKGTQPATGSQADGGAPSSVDAQDEGLRAAYAAILRYYEPLLARHGLSARTTIEQISTTTTARDAYGVLADSFLPQLSRLADRLLQMRSGRRNTTITISGDDDSIANARVGTLFRDIELSLGFIAARQEPMESIDLATILADPQAVVDLNDYPAPAPANRPNLIIKHGPDGTTVHGTRKIDKAIHAVLKDHKFDYSKPQKMWYQRRNRSFDIREAHVQGLRTALERDGVPYTLDSPFQDVDAAEPRTGTPQTAQSPTADAGSPTPDGPGPSHEPKSTTTAETPHQPHSDALFPISTDETAPGTGDASDDSAAPQPGNDDDRLPEQDRDTSKSGNPDASSTLTLAVPHTDGYRLHLDVTAGHGTIVDRDDSVIGWVRHRTADDGSSTWWAQDARGGPPYDHPIRQGHDPLAGPIDEDAPTAAARAASYVHHPMQRHRGLREPIAPDRVRRSVPWSRVAVLRELRPDDELLQAEGRDIELDVAGMAAYAEAARAAAAESVETDDASRERIARLVQAADALEFEQYDAARALATLAPPGEDDPYVGPYPGVISALSEAHNQEPTGASRRLARDLRIQHRDGTIGRVLESSEETVLVVTEQGPALWQIDDIQLTTGTKPTPAGDTTPPSQGNIEDRQPEGAAGASQDKAPDSDTEPSADPRVRLDVGDNTLVLDDNAGHGTVFDAEGRVLGWVRRRTSEEGFDAWWGQSAKGGRPTPPRPRHERMDSDPEHTGALAAAARVNPVSFDGVVDPDKAVLTLFGDIVEAVAAALPAAVDSSGEILGAQRTTMDLTGAQMREYAANLRAAADRPHSLAGAALLSTAEALELKYYDLARRIAPMPEPSQPDPYAAPFASGSLESTPPASAPGETADPDAIVVQAQAPDGVEIPDTPGHRLASLDVDDGHGTVLDSEGTLIGWVRARIRDDGVRVWWAQDADGGPPQPTGYEDRQPGTHDGAVTAAQRIRNWHTITYQGTRVPTTPGDVVGRLTVTEAQLRALRALPLPESGSNPWKDSATHYPLSIAHMHEWASIARNAADHLTGPPRKTAHARRTLRTVAGKLDFQAYDAGRTKATIPPPGQPDPYAGPFVAADPSPSLRDKASASAPPSPEQQFAAQARTPEGAELPDTAGHRLSDLDTDAGHGTVRAPDGSEIGWIRRRVAEDGTRAWWAQDADGGPPHPTPFTEDSEPDAAAIAAASSIRSERSPYFQGTRTPVAPEHAVGYVTLSRDQTHYLRQIPPPEGEFEGPPTVPAWQDHRSRYSFTVAQMQAWAHAARTADLRSEGPAENALLLSSAAGLDIAAYDTARSGATLPRPGQPDPYGQPFTPHPSTRPPTPLPEPNAAAWAEDPVETRVDTPDGPGVVIASDATSVLVQTELSTRLWHRNEVQLPDGDAPPERPEILAKARRNLQDLEQATTAEGLELRGGIRLRDLDPAAGHGTVTDADGDLIGWVRARVGDDGRRYWWAQDAAGGPPDDMPFGEDLPPEGGVPAARAAENVRPGYRSRRGDGDVVEPLFASREVTLTVAQVRELSGLTIAGTLPDGSELTPPDWHPSLRRYVLSVAQMQNLAEAARAAATTTGQSTPGQRRTQQVLINAAEKLDFEAYDTARLLATIPPIGERDPYARPYAPSEAGVPHPPAMPLAGAAAPAPAPAQDTLFGTDIQTTEPRTATVEHTSLIAHLRDLRVDVTTEHSPAHGGNVYLFDGVPMSLAAAAERYLDLGQDVPGRPGIRMRPFSLDAHPMWEVYEQETGAVLGMLVPQPGAANTLLRIVGTDGENYGSASDQDLGAQRLADQAIITTTEPQPEPASTPEPEASDNPTAANAPRPRAETDAGQGTTPVSAEPKPAERPAPGPPPPTEEHSSPLPPRKETPLPTASGTTPPHTGDGLFEDDSREPARAADEADRFGDLDDRALAAEIIRTSNARRDAKRGTPEYVQLGSHLRALKQVQANRTLEQLPTRPQPAELPDLAAVDAEHAKLLGELDRFTFEGPEWHLVNARLRAVADEGEARWSAELANRPEPATMDEDALDAELSQLAGKAVPEYRDTLPNREARQRRSQAIGDELTARRPAAEPVTAPTPAPGTPRWNPAPASAKPVTPTTAPAPRSPAAPDSYAAPQETAMNTPIQGERTIEQATPQPRTTPPVVPSVPQEQPGTPAPATPDTAIPQADLAIVEQGFAWLYEHGIETLGVPDHLREGALYGWFVTAEQVLHTLNYTGRVPFPPALNTRPVVPAAAHDWIRAGILHLYDHGADLIDIPTASRLNVRNTWTMAGQAAVARYPVSPSGPVSATGAQPTPPSATPPEMTTASSGPASASPQESAPGPRSPRTPQEGATRSPRTPEPAASPSTPAAPVAVDQSTVDSAAASPARHAPAQSLVDQQRTALPEQRVTYLNRIANANRRLESRLEEAAVAAKTWAQVGPGFDATAAAVRTWEKVAPAFGHDRVRRDATIDLVSKLKAAVDMSLPTTDGQVLAAPIYRKMSANHAAVSRAAARLAPRSGNSAERMALRQLASRSDKVARELRQISNYFEQQERPYQPGLMRLAATAAQNRARALVFNRSSRWYAVQEAPADERKAVREQMRQEYRDARPVLRAAWQNWWMDQITPEELGAVWQTATEWSAHGDKYAAATLEHLREEVRDRFGIAVPHHDFTGVDLVALLARPDIGLDDPNAPVRWYRYTITDSSAPRADASTGYLVAARWESPEEVAARLLQTHGQDGSLRALNVELVHSDRTQAVGQVAAQLGGDQALDVLRQAQQRLHDPEEIAAHAELLLADLTPERWETMSQAEAEALWALTDNWSSVPACEAVRDALAAGMRDVFGVAPDSAAGQPAAEADGPGQPQEEVEQRRQDREAHQMDRFPPFKPAAGPVLTDDQVGFLAESFREAWKTQFGRDLDADQEQLLDRVLRGTVPGRDNPGPGSAAANRSRMPRIGAEVRAERQPRTPRLAAAREVVASSSRMLSANVPPPAPLPAAPVAPPAAQNHVLVPEL